MGRGGKVKPNYTGINNALAHSALKSGKTVVKRDVALYYIWISISKNAFDYLTLLKFEKIINSTSIL